MVQYAYSTLIFAGKTGGYAVDFYPSLFKIFHT
jgi:hypothetical protein